MRSLLAAALLALAAPALADAPATQPAVIVVDVTKAPELADYAPRVQAVSDAWYPKVAALLPSAGYAPPERVVITFDPAYEGIAAAAGNRVICNPDWYVKRPDDLGSIVHELAHVVQAYEFRNVPGWLTEGIADYVRWFVYEPESARPKPDPEKAKHTDSYRTSAHFLDWAQRAHDPKLVEKLNAACRQGKYDEALWIDLTGKPLAELGAAWKTSLR